MRARPAVTRRCAADETEMIGVDFGNDERHQRVHPRGPCVADHEVTGGGECRFELRRYRRVERGEHQARSLARRAGLNLHAADTSSGTAASRGAMRRHRRRPCPPTGRSPPSHVGLNHGWPASRRMNCCPTIPVAPRMPTSIVLLRRSVHCAHDASITPQERNSERRTLEMPRCRSAGSSHASLSHGRTTGTTSEVVGMRWMKTTTQTVKKLCRCARPDWVPLSSFIHVFELAASFTADAHTPPTLQSHAPRPRFRPMVLCVAEHSAGVDASIAQRQGGFRLR